jgi:hypothetical protein
MKGFVSILIVGLIAFVSGCTDSAPLSDRELATTILAQESAKAVRPKKVLVISNPFSQQAGSPEQVYDFEKAGVSGLQKGFGKGIKIDVVFPQLKPEVLKNPRSVQVDPQTTTPLSFLVSEQAFSDVLQKHPDADLVVSLIGLPLNLGGFKQWNQPGKPQFALLFPDWRMIGNEAAIVRAFQSGKLIAAVARKPVPTEVQGDAKAQFDAKYFLVTRDNVEGLMKEHPAIFLPR